MHHGYAYKKTDKKKINSKIDRNKKKVNRQHYVLIL